MRIVSVVLTVLTGCILLLASAGCSKATRPSLHGKITTASGKTVQGGTIKLYTGNVRYEAAFSKIRRDGGYSLEAEPGTYKVTIETESIKRDESDDVERARKEGRSEQEAHDVKEKMAELRAKIGADKLPTYVPIDSKYKRPDTTPLSVTVGGGNQEQDWVVED